MAWFDNVASAGPNENEPLLSNRKWLLVSGFAIVLFAVAGFFIARGMSSSSPASAAPPPTIAPKSSPNHAGASPFGSGKFAAVGTTGIVSGKASNGHSFTMKTNSGSVVTVEVDTSTTYRSDTSTGLSFSSLATGDVVVVSGTTHGSRLQAKVIVIGQAASRNQGGGSRGAFKRGGGIFGSVTAISNAQHSFTVATRSGTTTTVDVGSSTIYRDLARGESGSFSLITVGERVVVSGSANSSGVVQATAVNVVTTGGFGGGFGPGPRGSGNTGAGSLGA